MKKKIKKGKEVEVTRSFSLKINLGNFEMAEFFAAQNAYCAPKDAEKIGEALHEFVKGEVVKSANKFKAYLRETDAKKSGDVGRDSAEQDAQETGNAEYGQT